MVAMLYFATGMIIEIVVERLWRWPLQLLPVSASETLNPYVMLPPVRLTTVVEEVVTISVVMIRVCVCESHLSVYGSKSNGC